MISPKAYWEAKILKWESARYSVWGKWNPMTWSLRARMEKAAEFLKIRAENKQSFTVLDLGCGSGLLLGKLDKISSVHYLGVDISEAAIAKAQKKYTGSKHQFTAADILTFERFPAADVTVLLGVSDWISAAELTKILSVIQSPWVLISYTSHRKSLKELLYQTYRRTADQKIRALSYQDAVFKELYLAAGWVLSEDLSDRLMEPGKLLCLKKATLTK